ncbi:MAG: 1-deoxy-D-xylulose-5-phosphate reductoisomerase [Candidatus Omnitrophica bacterium]|nr:1-deoxy-D-xylulose-5-phosphate reductoisomerase [Candidatus Omnitrophota bacterium]MBU1894568.1 1-deoxy-D-xylulose-5-phosphate reductoisomerase [Candidatus Omnitrophota bacterium]
MKNIILLGSTGSVGKNVLDVVKCFPEKFRIKAITSNSNVSLLTRQAKEFKPEVIAIGDKARVSELKSNLSGNTKIFAGIEGLESIINSVSADIIFVAISGRAALRPLFCALNTGRTIALASKEPIVSAGMLINDVIKKDPFIILPVDSEHSAIMQCLSGRSNREVKTLYITGSGGSLNNTAARDFDSISMEQVLNHPKWDMGKKITVDSATLMNKGLEAIEARWLFDVPAEKIKIIIHPEAIIHSMVEFSDGTINAGLFAPDMRFPILKALSFPEIMENDFPKIDFSIIKKLSFSQPDTDKFPSINMAFNALKDGGTMPAVLNAGNEAAVNLFLEGRIKFTEIIKIVEKVLSKHKKIDTPFLIDIIEAEDWAIGEVQAFC